jgi:hypothetical protein
MKINITKSRQAGASIMEVMIAMSISLVVTAAMIALMTNSLGTTTRIIKMTKLTDDLRTTMQMMSRDVRRSNYNVEAYKCYANDDCMTDGAVTAVGEITISAGNDCFWYSMDRNWDDYAETAKIAAGGFRRVTSGGVGVIEMWTGGAAPDCSSGAGATGWVQITNPQNMDISAFFVEEDPDLSYTQLVQDDGMGNVLSQKIRKVRLNMLGRLVMDDSIERYVEDVITVRNDLLL